MKHLITVLVLSVLNYSTFAENTEEVHPVKMLDKNLQISVNLKIVNDDRMPVYSVTTSGGKFTISGFYNFTDNTIIRVKINGIIEEIKDGKYHINYNILLDKPIIMKISKGKRLEYCKTGASGNIILKQGESIKVSQSKTMSIYLQLSEIKPEQKKRQFPIHC